MKWFPGSVYQFVKLCIIAFFLLFIHTGPCCLAAENAADDEQVSVQAEDVIQRAFDYWRGMSSISKFSMLIHRSDFEREMVMKGWTKGRDKALFFIEFPAKDYGNGSLKKGRSMWSYNPKINRAVKIPPSMMNQSWMGSDFSNDDLAKSDSILTDYNYQIIATEIVDTVTVYTVEAIAKDDAPVVWGKQIIKVREDAILVQQTFYDEEMVPVKEMVAEHIEMLGGRMFPRIWTMKRIDEDNQYTRLEYLELVFDEEIEDRIFTLNSLKTRRR